MKYDQYCILNSSYSKVDTRNSTLQSCTCTHCVSLAFCIPPHSFGPHREQSRPYQPRSGQSTLRSIEQRRGEESSVSAIQYSFSIVKFIKTYSVLIDTVICILNTKIQMVVVYVIAHCACGMCGSTTPPAGDHPLAENYVHLYILYVLVVA